MERIAGFVYDKSKLIIAFVVILNIVSAASFVRFGLDTDFLSFFSGGNPKAVEYNQLNEEYQTGETISILVEQGDSLLDKENISDVYRLQEEIRAIPGISLVQGFVPPDMPVQGEIITVDEELIETEYEAVRNFIDDKYFLKDQFLSPDGKQGMLIASLSLDAVSGDVVDSLKEIAENEEHLDLILAGNVIIKDTIWGYLIRVFVLMPCAVLVILLVFFMFLRVRLFAVLAFIPAAFAALWVFGTLFWSGQELDIVTVLSPMFIIVIGSAFGLHYVSHFSENMRVYSNRRQLTVETYRMVGTPIFLAAITTMAGFAALTWTKVMPMRDMGIFVTLGIFFAGFLALFFVPAVLSRVKLPAKMPEPKAARLSRLMLAASRRRAPIIIVFVSIVVVSAVYIPRIEVVSDQLMFFKEGSEIRDNFAKVDEYFGGALPLTGEVVSDNGLAVLDDHEYANEILAVERELEKLPGIRSVFSVFDLGKGVNRMITGQDEYPRDGQIVLGMLIRSGNPGMWVSDDGIRVTIRTQDFVTGDIAELEEFAASHEDTIRVITGMPLLFDEMNRLVVRSQLQSLGLAFGLIFIMLLVTLRRLGAALAGMLPIAITITAILGMLSLTGFQLNIMTANLSAISIGVGVDYSIHIISGIHYFRNRGFNRRQSVDAALSSVSRPVLGNALGLAIGMSVLFFSPIRIHFHAASVMWVAMVVSSTAALLLIPMLYAGRREARGESES
jgi:predicted RND superfamily exporter protein